MKILILGGTGYIGSALYLHLKEKHQIETVDLEWFGNYVNPDNIRLDYRELSHKFLAKFDVIILLAGHSSVAMCGDMASSFKNNVVNFIELLAKIQKGQKFIYASSSSVYGNTESLEVGEDWSYYRPSSFYDLNKQELDYYTSLSDVVEFYGLRFGTVNGYSPNTRSDLMLNQMFRSAKETGKIEIYNRNVNRPILGVNDLCRALEKIIEHGDHRGLYNLASFNISVGKIAEFVGQTLGVEIVDKGTSPTYNFSISNRKFMRIYDFEFVDLVGTIVNSFNDWDMRKSTRTNRLYV